MNHHISDMAGDATAANTRINATQFRTLQTLDSLDMRYTVEDTHTGQIFSFDIRKVTERVVETKNILPIKRIISCVFIFMSFFADINAKNKYTKNTDILIQKSTKYRIFVADTEPIIFVSAVTIFSDSYVKEARGFVLSSEKVMWQTSERGEVKVDAVVLVTVEKDCTRYETLDGTYILWKGHKVLDYCPMDSEEFIRFAVR